MNFKNKNGFNYNRKYNTDTSSSINNPKTTDISSNRFSAIRNRDIYKKNYNNLDKIYENDIDNLTTKTKKLSINISSNNEDEFPALGGNVINIQKHSVKSSPSTTTISWSSIAKKADENQQTIKNADFKLKYRIDNRGKMIPIDAPETPYERQVRELKERRNRDEKGYYDGEDSDNESVHEYVIEEIEEDDDDYYDNNDDDEWR